MRSRIITITLLIENDRFGGHTFAKLSRFDTLKSLILTPKVTILYILVPSGVSGAPCILDHPIYGLFGPHTTKFSF